MVSEPATPPLTRTVGDAEQYDHLVEAPFGAGSLSQRLALTFVFGVRGAPPRRTRALGPSQQVLTRPLRSARIM
jgi:hypothetical protein